jgi:membrane protease subunit HflC
MDKKIISLLVALAIVLIVVSQSVYTVHETETAIVLQLGSPVKASVPPGLHFKKPFVQNIIRLDKRILTYDSRPSDALTSDKKAIVVDNYARWRIADPLLFYQTLRTVRMAQARLVDIVYSELRVMIGRHTLEEVISSKRNVIMDAVLINVNELTKELGVEVIDVRIMRTDLPPENQQAIFGRMQAEREREARQYRSEGEEEAQRIRSSAERDVAVILAEARSQAEIIRGEGDADAIRIFAEALDQSPDFYEFYRSLVAYRNSLRENSRILLRPGEDFLRFFR